MEIPFSLILFFVRNGIQAVEGVKGNECALEKHFQHAFRDGPVWGGILLNASCPAVLRHF
ncbi:hypothetical protein HMPREF3039_02093 [Akkermansia sp. KLE1798]|nr:hypothetical protein HMPREF3039_02093 [Akkermansia sp. KLE1798]KZA03530.1 hypothetical protein HMPREF1326_02831 [Akkermansia sp. KLE1605]